MTPLNLTMSYLRPNQRGYRRGNEVFRPAKVVVSDPSQAEAAAVTMTIWYPKCHRLGVSEYWARQLHGGASSKRFPTIIQLCGIYIDSVPCRKPIPQR
jgi:hypothetical protein